MEQHNGAVLIAAPVHPVLIEGLELAGYSCNMHVDIRQNEAHELIKNCVGVITSTRLQLNRQLIDAAPKLAWIGRMGSGMEVIDVAYAAERGIKCYGSPEGNSNAVAEHAVGMLLSLMRHISWSNNEIKAGIWMREENRGAELEGKTLGIIGFGHTGSSFARILSGFDLRILAYDKHPKQQIPGQVTLCDTGRIFEEADIVSFHVPLQADTINYFNREFINAMHKPFILINTSRGTVVNTAHLYEGLISGKVKGACLDVFEHEPISASPQHLKTMIDAMLLMPNVIATPHIAGYSHEALYKMSAVLLNKVTGTGN